VGDIHGHCDERFAAVREAFEASFASGEVGAAVAVHHGGALVVDLWGGSKDAAGTQPWERDTIVNVYSTTKGMTALCAHRLVEEGRLDLDAPVAAYWPEFAAAGKENLPVRYLLSHQAGLPAVKAPLPADALYDWDGMCAALAAQAPWWEPGTRHGYHALTFGYLIGEIVRRIDGRSLGTYFREEIAAPLGLDFHIGLPESEHERVADMIPAPSAGDPSQDMLAKFMEDAGEMTGLAFNNPKPGKDAMNTKAWRTAEIPAGNGHGDARSLARVYGCLASGGALDGVRLLAPESIAQARTEQAMGPDAVLMGMPMRFGLGFMLRQDFMPLGSHESAFGHPGAGGSIGYADPELGLGFGYVMNQMQQGMAGDVRGWSLIAAVNRSLGAD
jgi:CubicO group peptidase (beta-lactamase class C family)